MATKKRLALMKATGLTSATTERSHGQTMSKKVITLGEVKAEKTGDSRHWTPLEALEALVRDIKSGDVIPDKTLCCLMWTKNKAGESEFFQRWAGVTQNEAVSILSLAHFKACKSWDE